MKHRHPMPFGAELLESGGVRFRLWAPSAAQLVLEHEKDAQWRSQPMTRSDDGWHEATVADAAAGDLYRYLLPDGLKVPDPASRRNPDDVHGPSEVVDPHAYAWKHGDWRGRPWQEAVIYEMHVGTFTPEGTFAAAQAHLADLAALGITTLELMPLADFPGLRNWGYDGVLQFAPDASYGTPAELKALVDHAHSLGMLVLIDVVYNHFGPEGNYLHAYCPEFFNPAHQTPWARPSTLTASVRARCATSSSTTRCTGSRSTASTGCAWTPSMRFATTPKRRSCTRSALRCATVRGASGTSTSCSRTN
ncbi:MAG: alpha-amylase family glycosyl hydrolase [Variovorax sp.]